MSVVVDVPGSLDGERVDRAIATLCDVSRRSAAAAVDEGGVVLAGRPVRSRSARVTGGQRLEVTLVPEQPAVPQPDPGVAVAVVEADDWVVVVDKPAGLVVHPGSGHREGTLVNGLLARFPEMAGVGDPARPGIVHRLDVGTSGLMVVARQAAAHHSLVEQLAAREVERRYLALVWGEVASDSGLVEAALGRSGRDPTRMAVVPGGREARTRYQVTARFEAPRPTTLLECRLETGRTHQIRVHLSAIGHPVVGDERYGGRRPGIELERPFLHAHHLAFDHPGEKRRRAWSSDLPADLEELRGALG